MVNPCKAGFSAVRVSTKTRASAAYRSGSVNTMLQPITEAMDAAVNAIHRKRQTLRTSSRTRSNSCFMTRPWASESGFRHHQYIAWLERQVLLHVALIQERVELHLDFRLLAVLGA